MLRANAASPSSLGSLLGRPDWARGQFKAGDPRLALVRLASLFAYQLLQAKSRKWAVLRFQWNLQQQFEAWIWIIDLKAVSTLQCMQDKATSRHEQLVMTLLLTCLDVKPGHHDDCHFSSVRSVTLSERPPLAGRRAPGSAHPLCPRLRRQELPAHTRLHAFQPGGRP